VVLDILRAGPGSPPAPPTVRSPAEPSALLLEVLATADSPQRFLQDVVDLAVRVVPGCAWAGITVVRDGSYPGTAASDERAELITRAQYLHGDGPCLRATGSGRPELIGDVRAVPLGPAWHQAALAAGVTAVMALPLHTPTADDAGVLALHAVEPGGWPPLAAERAGALAAATGRALTIADRLAAAAAEERPGAAAAP
jgi:GAF domain-containing protein